MHIVNEEWYTNIEYKLKVYCPYCDFLHNEIGLNLITDGRYINKKVTCFCCEKKFKLRVKKLNIKEMIE